MTMSAGQMGDVVREQLVLKLPSGGEFESWGVGTSAARGGSQQGRISKVVEQATIQKKGVARKQRANISAI